MRCFRLFSASVAIVLASCAARDRVASPEVTSAILLAADAGTPKAPAFAVSEDDAIKIVLDLPEAKDFAALIKARGAAHRLAIYVEDSPKPGCASGAPECRYYIYVGEEEAPRVTVWNRFQVDSTSRAIWVYDADKDVAVPYATWHAKKHS